MARHAGCPHVFVCNFCVRIDDDADQAHAASGASVAADGTTAWADGSKSLAHTASVAADATENGFSADGTGDRAADLGLGSANVRDDGATEAVWFMGLSPRVVRKVRIAADA